MGEKEVQVILSSSPFLLKGHVLTAQKIWFQNRRQNDRRRSKPLDAHELMAHMRKSQTPPTKTTSVGDAKSEGDDSARNRLTASHHAHLTPTPFPISEVPLSPPASDVNETSGPSPIAEAGPESLSVTASHPDDAVETPPSTMKEQMHQQATPKSNSKAKGEITSGSGRKRPYAEMSRDDRAAPQVSPIVSQAVPRKPKEPLKRASSVRLSMTADGAVKIRTGDDPTPSPPKERSLPPSASQMTQIKPLRRSLSLFENRDGQQEDRSCKPRLLNADFGRSRDARTWEFYCDNSSKDALSTQVEAERNGSAVGAINLIRFGSHKSRGAPMTPLLSKGNTQLGPAGPKLGKPKMQRVKSSFARLQGSEGDVLSEKRGGSKQSRHVRSPSGDSDKENWAPGTRLANNPLRRTQPSNNRRPILQTNEGATFRDVRARATAAGGTAKTSAGGDDLDCIQGLLSLSQGAWR